MNLDPIQKYKILWTIGVTSLIISVGYTIYFGEFFYWFISYLYFRILWFFTNGISLHRYFAHKSFKTGPLRHKFLAWVTILGGVGSPYTWTIHHRHHHKYSDTEFDLHSPGENKLQSILGTWAVKPLSWWNDKKVNTIPRDLYKDPTVMFINSHYYKLWSIVLVISLLLGGWKFTLFFLTAPIGWNLLHGALNNCFNHMTVVGSYRNYNTNDTSQNNTLINWYLLGEGLHNNHHAQPGNYNQAHRKGEFDLGAIVIKRFFEVAPNETL
jgi:stearoyl-CoA desaturase (delta-9 desaturase)